MSGFQTPVQQVGPSAKKGAGTWKVERITSVILIPLTLWALWSGAQLSGGTFEGAVEWLRTPLNTGLTLITLAFTAWHMALGMNVVIEDYIHGALGRVSLLLNTLFCWALFIAGAAATIAVHTGFAFGA